MDCADNKKLIPALLSGELEETQAQAVQRHGMECRECRKELAAYEKTRDMLVRWKDLESDPAYISRFWVRAAAQERWFDRLKNGLRSVLGPRAGQ